MTDEHLQGWMIVLYIYFYTFLIGTGFLLYRAAKGDQISQRMKPVIFGICQFHISVAFWSCNSILLYSLMEAKDNQTRFYSVTFDHAGMVAWHIFLLVLNFIFGGILSVYSFDPLKGANDLAMSTPMPQILSFAFKAIISLLILVLDQGTTLNWLLALFSLIILVYRHYHSLRVFPYYEFKPLYISVILTSFGVLISFFGILVLIFSDIRELTGSATFYLQAFLIVLLVKCSQIYLNKDIQRFLRISNDKLKSEEDVLKKVFALEYMLRNTNLTMSNEDDFSIRELQFWGFWSKLTKGSSIDQVISISGIIQEKVNKEIYDLLLEMTGKIQKGHLKIKIFFVNFIIQKDLGIIKGLGYLKRLKDIEGFTKVKVSYLWEKYQEKVNSRYEGELDVKGFLEFEMNSRTFVEMIYANCKRYVDFWKSYTVPTGLELIDLVHQSSKIEESDVKIKNFWDNFELKDKFLQRNFLLLYSVYLSIVRNAKYSALKLQEKMGIFEKNDHYRDRNFDEFDMLTQETLMSAENLIFHIAITKDNFGKVLYVSEDTAKRLGWKKKEVLKKTVEEIIPKFIRKSRMEILRGESSSSGLNKVLNGFLVHNKNYLVPGSVYFCLYPNIQEELKILVIFRPIQRELLVLNKEGIVQGFTRRVGDAFGLKDGMEIGGKCENYKELNSLISKLEKSANHEELEFKKNEIMLRFNVIKGEEEKEYNVMIEKLGVEDKYFLLKFQSKDFPSFLDCEEGEMMNFQRSKKKKKSTKLLSKIKKTTQDEDEEEVPSEGIWNTLNSPVTSSRKFFQKHVVTLSPKSPGPTIGEENYRITTEAIPGFRFSSETSVILDEPNKKSELIVKAKFSDHSLRSEDYIETGQSSQTSSGRKLEFEEALHQRPQERPMKTLNILFILYMIGVIALLINFRIYHSRKTNIVTNNIEMATAAMLRLMRIENLYAQSGALIKLEEGTFFQDRYLWLGVPNLKYSSVNQIGIVASDLLKANTNLRQYVSKIEEKFYSTLYTELPMYFYDKNGSVVASQMTNPFDLVSQIVATGEKILHMLFPLVRGYSPEGFFIYKNSVDQLLVLGEQVFDVIVDDTDAKLSRLSQLTGSFLGAIGFLGCSLFGFFMYIMAKLKQDRGRIIDIFSRLDEEELVSHNKLVESFCSIMLQNDMGLQLVTDKIQTKRDLMMPRTVIKQAFMRKGKRVITVGMHSRLIQIAIAFGTILVVVFSGYLIGLRFVSVQSQNIKTKVNLLIDFNFLAYEHSLLKFVLPDYLGGHVNMTFRSKPFREEWNRTFEKNTLLGDKFYDIIDKEKGFGEDEMLVGLVTGDLCELIVTDVTKALLALGFGNPCDKIKNGLARKGAKAAYDFSMYWMREVLANYEASGKTKLDSIRALNATDQRQMEMLGVVYTKAAFEKISIRMEAQLKSDAEKFIRSILVLVIVYVMVYIAIVLIFWPEVERAFCVESIKWKRLFKLVPESVILSNKILKLYLLKDLKKRQ